LGQLFHKNNLFFEAFEVVTISNGSSILIFFQKIEIIENQKYSKIWNRFFLKNSNNCPILIHLMFTSNYLRNGHGVLPWYNVGFTQFLGHGHNKLMIAQNTMFTRTSKVDREILTKKFF
jgi:hypothetical protein